MIKLMKPAQLKSIALTFFILATSFWSSSYALANATSLQHNKQTTQQNLRIIALAPHVVEMLFAIGAGENIVGTVDYADYPKQALNIPRVGGHYGIQIEKILALKPDLIVVWKSGYQSSDIQKLQSLGLKVIFSEPKKIDDVASQLRLLGQATYHQVQAEQVAQDYQQRLQQLRTNNTSKKPLKVFYQLWSQPMMTINKNTQIHQLIEVCQGQNVFADNPTDYPKIGIENVILAQPELIIIPSEKSDRPQPDIGWHNWPEIPAVKQQQFIKVNADLLHRFSPRMLDGIEDMCNQMDRFR